MKQSSTRNNRLLVARVLTLCLTLASVSLAVAQSNYSAQNGWHKECSNRTIAGNYGVQIEGTILGPNLTLRTLVMERFDGAGNFTSVDHVVLGGQPPAEEWRPTTGRPHQSQRGAAPNCSRSRCSWAAESGGAPSSSTAHEAPRAAATPWVIRPTDTPEAVSSANFAATLRGGADPELAAAHR